MWCLPTHFRPAANLVALQSVVPTSTFQTWCKFGHPSKRSAHLCISDLVQIWSPFKAWCPPLHFWPYLNLITFKAWCPSLHFWSDVQGDSTSSLPDSVDCSNFFPTSILLSLYSACSSVLWLYIFSNRVFDIFMWHIYKIYCSFSKSRFSCYACIGKQCSFSISHRCAVYKLTTIPWVHFFNPVRF